MHSFELAYTSSHFLSSRYSNLEELILYIMMENYHISYFLSHHFLSLSSWNYKKRENDREVCVSSNYAFLKYFIFFLFFFFSTLPSNEKKENYFFFSFFYLSYQAYLWKKKLYFLVSHFSSLSSLYFYIKETIWYQNKFINDVIKSLKFIISSKVFYIKFYKFIFILGFS